VNVFINHTQYTLDGGATLADAIALAQVIPPFAAAVNLQFVPKAQYAARTLHDDDRIDLISPVTGG
jgi:sulfur carrier protein